MLFEAVREGSGSKMHPLNIAPAFYIQGRKIVKPGSILSLRMNVIRTTSGGRL
jgi:hypothetical protein